MYMTNSWDLELSIFDCCRFFCNIEIKVSFLMILKIILDPDDGSHPKKTQYMCMTNKWDLKLFIFDFWHFFCNIEIKVSLLMIFFFFLHPAENYNNNF